MSNNNIDKSIISDLYERNFDLYKERKRIEQILFRVREIVIAVDQNERITLFNREAEDAFKISVDDTLGKHLSEVVKIYKSDTKREINYKLLLKKDSSRYIHDLSKRHLSLVPDVASSDYYRISVADIDYGRSKKEFVIILTNVTDEVTLDKQKDEFISVASHELKTPIIVSLNNLWMFLRLTEQLQFDQKQKLMLANVKDGLVRLQKIVNELLDISRISEGRLTLEIDVFDITKVLDESIGNFSNLLQEKGLKIKRSYLGGINVKADKFKVTEIVVNLLSNAVKYTEKGYIEVSVDKDENGYIKTSIKDSGLGIDEKDRQKLFTKFGRGIQGQKLARVGASTGLGLYIAKNYVEKMGGRIGYTTKIGEGSTFWFSLPQSEESN